MNKWQNVLFGVVEGKQKKKKDKQKNYSESSDSQELWGLAARIRMDTQSLWC